MTNYELIKKMDPFTMDIVITGTFERFTREGNDSPLKFINWLLSEADETLEKLITDKSEFTDEDLKAIIDRRKEWSNK